MSGNLRNEVWGENFPREYESYLKTLKTDFASKHGGSKMIDYLEKYPELVVLWAGYAFSREYNQGRGHAHAIEDIRNILRTGDNEFSHHNRQLAGHAKVQMYQD